MTSQSEEIAAQRLPAGHAEFARYAFPPNELGYCGPANSSILLQAESPDDIAAHAREFDGAWPYLQALSEVSEGADPLDEEIVRSYWVGGPLLSSVDPGALSARLRTAFHGQVTGLLDRLDGSRALAHHSFHVFVVYPWVRFLDRDAVTAVKVMQDCRVRWGTVQAVHDDHVLVVSRPLVWADGLLALGPPAPEWVCWRKDGATLTSVPEPGQTVSAHWDWVCATLTPTEAAALQEATTSSLEIVNEFRSRT